MFKQKRITGIITLSILLAISITMPAGCSVSNKTTSEQTSDANESGTTTATISETEGTTTAAISETEETTPEKTLDERLAFLDDSVFHGTVLIAEGGEIVFEKSYKYSNIESQELNTNDTRYEIGSVTKQFTAVGLMMLVEEGKINLDDTLDKYIPEYSHADEVTIRQLLNMTSGIVDYMNDGMFMMDYKKLILSQIFADKEVTESVLKLWGQRYDFTTVLSLVDTYDLEFEPGSRWDYSNTGYCFISEVIARVSGMSFEDYMMQNVLSPAGLETASFEPDQNTATGYMTLGGQTIEMPDDDITGEGGLLMTAEDLYTWTQVIENKELLSEESWNEILDGGEHGYGFGIDIAEEHWGHTGSTHGFICMEYVYKQPNVVIIFITNSKSESGSEAIKRILNNTQYHFDLPLTIR